MSKTENPNTQPPREMGRGEWIKHHNFEHIPKWDIEICLKYLTLSETSQKKLPGTDLTPGKVREIVADRIRELLRLPNPQKQPEPTTHKDILLTDAFNLQQFLVHHKHSTNYRPGYPVMQSSFIEDVQMAHQKNLELLEKIKKEDQRRDELPKAVAYML